MFQYIRSLFSSDIYIQLWHDRLKVSLIGSHHVFDEVPLLAIKYDQKRIPSIVAMCNAVRGLDNTQFDKLVNPFDHPRLLVHDFVVGEKVVHYAIRKLHQSKWVAPSSRVIFQPMEKLEGGITGIEERLYRELCLGAGAREFLLYTGDVLLPHAINFDQLKASKQ